MFQSARNPIPGPLRFRSTLPEGEESGIKHARGYPVPEQPVAAGTSTTQEFELLLDALTKVQHGDFTARLPLHWTGVHGKIADAFNDMVAHNQRLSEEMERVRRAVGGEGKTTQRLSLNGSEGSMGGGITVTSEIGRGSVFTIELPVAATRTPDAAPSSADMSPASA